MDVSAVIVNWNTCELLRGCLASLGVGDQGSGVRNLESGVRDQDSDVGDRNGKNSTSDVSDGLTHAQSGHDPRYPTPNTGLQVEVIVVDNASSDGSAEMVRNEFPDVKLIDSGENLGWAKGNNVGIEVSTGRYLFLLNPDTVVHAGALESLTAFMDARPGAGACAPLLLNPDGTIQRSLRRFPEPVSLLWDVLGMAKLFPHSGMFAAYRMGDFPYDRVAEVDQPMGAALFLRKETLERVGLMDEAFPIFFNDVDWCYRAVQAGWKIYFVPKAKVTHYGGSSTSQVKPKMVAESHRSLERFYRKHYRDRIPSAVFQAIMAMSRMAERLRIARARL